MPQPSCAKVIILVAALVYGPTFAQGEPDGTISSEAKIIAPLAGISIAESSGDTLAAAPVEATSQPVAVSSDKALNTSIGAVEQFMNRNAVEPVILAAHSTGEWVASGADALITATDDASAWIKSQSDNVAIASQNTYDWLNARVGFVMSAAQDTSDWIVTQSQHVATSAQDAADWLVTNTQAAAESVTASLDGISVFGDWSAGFVDEIKKRLTGDESGEFAELLKESGYELANVAVGVGLIPELVVEFRHDHDLSLEQRKAFRKKVDEYANKVSGVMGYLEMILLRNLMRADDLSQDIRVSELHIKLFPLPSLELLFDPYMYEKQHDQIIHNAKNAYKRGAAKIAELENRIKRLEAQLSVLNQ